MKYCHYCGHALTFHTKSGASDRYSCSLDGNVRVHHVNETNFSPSEYGTGLTGYQRKLLEKQEVGRKIGKL